MRKYVSKLAHKNVSVEYAYDLVDKVWENRPELADEPVFLLEEKYAGESRASKLDRVRNAMKEEGAGCHILTTLDDIAWLLNIRGNDVMYSPLVLCYAVVEMDKVCLFIGEGKLDENAKAALARDGVKLMPYNDIYEYVKSFGCGDAVLIDPVRINYALYKNIPAHTKKIEKENPAIIFKAVKNPVELANIEKAHIKDGVAFTKLMYWLKKCWKVKDHRNKRSEKLEEFRKQQEGYLWQSFSPISAFKDHAAMMHYSLHRSRMWSLKKGTSY